MITYQAMDKEQCYDTHAIQEEVDGACVPSRHKRLMPLVNRRIYSSEESDHHVELPG